MSQQVALMFMPATMGYIKDHAPSFFFYLFPNWVAEQCPRPSVDIQVNFLPLDPYFLKNVNGALRGLRLSSTQQV
jgi:hypothetical protein